VLGLCSYRRDARRLYDASLHELSVFRKRIRCATECIHNLGNEADKHEFDTQVLMSRSKPDQGRKDCQTSENKVNSD